MCGQYLWQVIIGHHAEWRTARTELAFISFAIIEEKKQLFSLSGFIRMIREKWKEVHCVQSITRFCTDAWDTTAAHYWTQLILKILQRSVSLPSSFFNSYFCLLFVPLSLSVTPRPNKCLWLRVILLDSVPFFFSFFFCSPNWGVTIGGLSSKFFVIIW